jgi:hypothetical protein
MTICILDQLPWTEQLNCESCKHIFTYTHTDLLPLAVCILQARILLVCHPSLLTNISFFSERNTPRHLEIYAIHS